MSGFALCKHDGSLENGFEIVTAPATLSVHKDRWAKFCEKNYADSLSSWNTATCGMHVHVGQSITNAIRHWQTISVHKWYTQCRVH